MSNEIPLRDLTKIQLLDKADAEGYPLSSAMSKADILNIMERMAGTAKQVVVNTVAEEDRGTTNRIPPGKIRLRISREAGDKKQRPVFLGHNNIGYLVPRNKEVDFPAIAISSLTDAIEVNPVWDDELETGTDRGGYTLEERQSYPYQIIGFGDSVTSGPKKRQVNMDELMERLGY